MTACSRSPSLVVAQRPFSWVTQQRSTVGHETVPPEVEVWLSGKAAQAAPALAVPTRARVVAVPAAQQLSRVGQSIEFSQPLSIESARLTQVWPPSELPSTKAPPFWTLPTAKQWAASGQETLMRAPLFSSTGEDGAVQVCPASEVRTTTAACGLV